MQGGSAYGVPQRRRGCDVLGQALQLESSPAVPLYTALTVPTMSCYLSSASIHPWQQLRKLTGFPLP